MDKFTVYLRQYTGKNNKVVYFYTAMEEWTGRPTARMAVYNTKDKAIEGIKLMALGRAVEIIDTTN